jgi:DNA processing protein
MATTLSRSERLDWLQLARCGGVGPRTFFKLLRRFGSAARAFAELPRLAAESGNPERWRRCPREVAEAELEAIAALGAHLLAHGEAAYPLRLAEIADPPPLLTVRGEPGLLAGAAVAVVGARNASASGRVLARNLAAELAGGGVTIVSGLARGIDTAAHDGALAAGGTTVAVLACGVDVAYPPDNAGLLARIVEAGAVVSERPLGAEPQARHFPKRNRLIAGLSLGVVVVEAAPQSGSLITARLAAEQGREVMAVPGSPLDPRHRGTNQLLREGAALVESAEDVRATLGPALAAAPRRRSSRPAASGASASPPPRQPPRAHGSTLAALICERLGPVPLLVDELIRQCDGRAAEVQRLLLELELAGQIERHPGNRVTLVAEG